MSWIVSSVRSLFGMVRPSYAEILCSLCEDGCNEQELAELLKTQEAVDLDSEHFVGTRREGYTPLTLAARSGHLDLVKYMCETLHCDVSTTDLVWKGTALHHACRKNHPAVTKYLIENQAANVNAITADGNLYTPLHWACARGNLQCVELLLEEKADLNSFDKSGSSPLHW
jgi:ankyrin repeat protein